MKIGIYFLVLQLAAAVAFESNNLILAQVLGPPAVTEYVVVSPPVPRTDGRRRPFSWRSVARHREAIVRGDMTWVRSALRRSIGLAFAFAVVTSLLIVAVHRPLLDLWVGTGFPAHFELVAALGVWTVLWSVGTTLSVFLNGAEFLKFQIGLAVAMAVTNVILSVFLTTSVGVSGVVWGSVVAYAAVTLVPLALFMPRLMARVVADHKRLSANA